jgi:O-succinylbenzoate synthase
LPGLSREGMTEAESQAACLRSWVIGHDLPDGLEELSGSFDTWLKGYDLAPSVRFGFETAVLNLVAAARGVPLRKLISRSPRDWISINCLLTGPPDKIMKKTVKLLKKGYLAFKLKVGRNPIREDIEITRDVRRIIGDDATLRLDANRAWDMDHALAFAKALAGVRIDYIEEPVKTFAFLKQLMDERLFPRLALDESLLELAPEDLPSLSGIKAIVLKPTLLGLEKTIRFARSAAPLGMTPVISSAFESGVGLGILAQVAASVNRRDVPAGLDTLDWFDQDLLVDSPKMERGRLQIAKLPDPGKGLKHDLLQAIRDD